MPLHDFYCAACDKMARDVRYSIREDVPQAVPCPCGGELRRQPPLIAKTPGRWGDQGGKHGVNGTYNQGLGVHVLNSVEREAEEKRQGLVPLSDLGGDDWWEKNTKRLLDEKAKDERMLSTYMSNVRKFGGDTVRAMTETMPAKACINGEYD